MSSVPSLFFRGSKSGNPASRENHESRLSDILKAWNMCRYDVEGDGNCCFTAASLSLTLNWKAFSNDERSAFAALGLLPSMDVETLAAHLRKLVVDEWLTNASYYQSFMVDSVQVEQEAVKFLDPGYFYGDLADTMVLSIANSLNVSIIVFSSIQCQPVIVITPRIQVTKLPLMLAYTQFGAGHYDAVMQCIKHTPTPHLLYYPHYLITYYYPGYLHYLVLARSLALPTLPTLLVITQLTSITYYYPALPLYLHYLLYPAYLHYLHYPAQFHYLVLPRLLALPALLVLPALPSLPPLPGSIPSPSITQITCITCITQLT